MSAGPPDWFTRGLPHVWLPYTQMRTAAAPLPVVITQGACIKLADGRELIDGIASWWTACHGYNHPHIAEAVTRQLGLMPHVMFGGLAHEPGRRGAGLTELHVDDAPPGALQRARLAQGVHGHEGRDGGSAGERRARHQPAFECGRGRAIRRRRSSLKAPAHLARVGRFGGKVLRRCMN